MSDERIELSIDARELYDLAYGRSRNITLVTNSGSVIIRAIGTLPSDEYEATVIVRRAKGFIR